VCSSPVVLALMCGCLACLQEVPTNVIVCGDFASERHSPPLAFAEMCGLNVVNDIISPFTGLWAPLGTFPSPKWRAFNSPDMILINSVSDAIKVPTAPVFRLIFVSRGSDVPVVN
jgi:hypothetical protein